MKQLFKHLFCVLLLALLMPITAVAQIDYGCWGTITVYLLETTTVTSQYDIPSGYEWKVKSMVWSSEKYSDSPYGDSYEIISQNGKTCEIKGRSFASSGKLYCKMKYGETDYIAYYNVNAISRGNLSISANPSGGTVNAGTKVYLTCNEVSGASIFYTTDGTDPIYNSNTFQPVNGSLYNSSGITINQTTTLKAFAAKKGYTSSQTSTWQYTVNVPVTSITLNKSSLSLQPGQDETLTATVKPDNATDKTVTWTSSNTNVATVTAGKVTAKAAGTATITCKANDGSGKQATCNVTVKAVGIDINATNFPDANFRNYLLSEYFGTDGILTEEEISKITSLILRDKNIKSLKGIEFFTALTYLSCDNNPLNSLDVSNNTALTDLYCPNCGLTSLDVSNNTNLSLLFCNENKLTSLNLSNNTALNILGCYENQLTFLNVSNIAPLTQFNCYRNELKGTAIDVLINSLPQSTGRSIHIYDNTKNDEGNICTKAQVAIAKAKGWKMYMRSGGNTWVYYEGIDDGDVNGDGEVNGTDIVAMTNMILGKTEKKTSADLNGDGEVNGTDYVMLVNIVLGK